MREDGTCLDGFADPQDCPNVATDENAGSTDIVPTDDPLTELDFPADDEVGDGPDSTPRRSSSPPTSYIGGDEALSMAEAGNVTAAKPSTVVLVAGDFASGKTTLVVELWAQFLEGSFHGWDFAGSKTLAAFDRRHSTARLSSGLAQATTERTQDDDMRLLHLEIAARGSKRSLLFSDVKGEFFGELVDGHAVAESVPLASRADLCVLVIDGRNLGNPADRAKNLWRSQLLLGALTEPGGLCEGTRVLLAVSKGDLLSRAATTAATKAIDSLLTLARTRNLEPEVVFVSARPAKAEDSPHGLEAVVDWLTSDDSHRPGEDPAPATQDGRFFWRAKLK